MKIIIYEHKLHQGLGVLTVSYIKELTIIYYYKLE